MIIKPTVGRIVYYFNNSDPTPKAAIITAIHSDNCIDAVVFNENNNLLVSLASFIKLVQPEGERPQEGKFCEWMPYQIKKPTGTESGEKAIGTQQI